MTTPVAAPPFAADDSPPHRRAASPQKLVTTLGLTLLGLGGVFGAGALYETQRRNQPFWPFTQPNRRATYVPLAGLAAPRRQRLAPAARWRVDQPEWPQRAQTFFRSMDNGTWQEEGKGAFAYRTATGQGVDGPNLDEARRCLNKRWIMMQGDSSLRFIFSSLISFFGGAAVADDPYMPKYQFYEGIDWRNYLFGLHFNRTDEDARHQAYFREYWDKDQALRLTFGFKGSLGGGAASDTLSMESFITESMQPDLVVLQSGSWNAPHESPNVTLAKVSDYIRTVRSYYYGPMLFVDTVPCQMPNWSRTFNQRCRDELDLPILPRHDSSVHLPLPLQPLCREWHAHGVLSDLHRDMLLHATCLQLPATR